MKPALLFAALLCMATSAFATDLKCHGRAESYDIEKNNIFSNSPNYEVINNKKDGFVVRQFTDDNATSSSGTFAKAKEWKEAGMTVVGHPHVARVYIHDRYNALLAEEKGGYDDVPEYTKYVHLTCE